MEQVRRKGAKPECISAETQRATARAWRSAGQMRLLGVLLGQILEDGEAVPDRQVAVE